VEAAAPTRRERKKRATRMALKAAAIDLVAERGLANVTVEDIADAVDVSVRTFFNYFASKEAAVVGDDPERVAEMKAELLGQPADLCPLEALRRVLVSRLAAMREAIGLSGEDDAVWARRLAAVRSQPEVASAYAKHLLVLEAALTDALVERAGGDEAVRFDAAVATAAAVGAMRSAASQWGGEGGTEALVRLADRAIEMVATGFRAAEPAGAGS